MSKPDFGSIAKFIAYSEHESDRIGIVFRAVYDELNKAFEAGRRDVKDKLNAHDKSYLKALIERDAALKELSDTRQLYYEVISQRNALLGRSK